MNGVSRQQTVWLYDRLSRWYDLIAGVWEWGAQARGLRKLGVGPGETVLEIGCGTGRALVRMGARVGPSGRVCGMDISPGMVSVARRRVVRAGLAERVEVRCGDAVQIPYPGAAFDAIFMSFVLEIFPLAEIPAVLGQCRRVLRADGRMAVVSLVEVEKPGPVARAYGWAGRRFPRWVDCRPIPVERLLAQAGFWIAEADRGSMCGLPFAVVLAGRE